MWFTYAAGRPESKHSFPVQAETEGERERGRMGAEEKKVQSM